MANLVNLFIPKAENRATFKDGDGWLYEWARGGKDPSGEYVTSQTAMGIAAYFACIRNISEDIAKLPIRLSRPRKDGGSEAIPVHEVLPLINRRCNPAMGAMNFWETIIGHALGYKGGFAEIVRDGGGRPLELWPLNPDGIRILYSPSTGELAYEVREEPGLKSVLLRPSDVFHIHGTGFDGLTGWVIAQIGKTWLGKAMATNKHSAGYFGNNTVLSGILQAPPLMKKEAIQNLAKSFRLRHQGAENAYKTAILTDGVEYKPISTNPVDAQLLESQQFNVEEVARAFRMPPNKIQHLLRSTYNNIEEENQSYKTDTLQPWSVRICQEIQEKLVGRDEPDVVCKHDFSMILEANHEAKTKARLNEFQMGMHSPNDLLKLENRTPLNKPGMDDHYVLANLIPISKAIAQTPEAAQQSPSVPKDPAALPKSFDAPFVELFADHFKKFITIEEDKAIRAKKRGNHELRQWIKEFYPAHHEHVTRALQSTVKAYVAALGVAADSAFDSLATAKAIASEYVKLSRERIESGCSGVKTATAQEFALSLGQAAAQICKGESNVSAR